MVRQVKISVAAIMVAALAVAEGNAKRIPLESLPVRCEKAVTVEGREPTGRGTTCTCRPR